MNESPPTQQKTAAFTVTERFKSMLVRLIGAKSAEKSGQPESTPSDTIVETIWSVAWCAENPQLAAIAIEALQDRVQILEDYIKGTEPKPRKRPLSNNPKAVMLSSLMPNTRFKLLRTGETYFTSGRSWRTHFKAKTGNQAKLHGSSRVEVLTQRQI